MHKILTGIATMALATSVSCTSAFAAGCGRGRNFVDIDQNGVCDHYNASCQFVDSDGDGVCDNYGSNDCGRGAGNGSGNCSGNGSGYQREHCGGHGGHGRCGR